MIKQILSAPCDPKSGQDVTQFSGSLGQGWRYGGTIAGLQEIDNACFIRPEGFNIPIFIPFPCQFALELGGFPIDPGAGIMAGKINEVGVGRRKCL